MIYGSLAPVSNRLPPPASRSRGSAARTNRYPANALPRLADCADVAALRAPVREPDDSAIVARIAATLDGVGEFETAAAFKEKPRIPLAKDGWRVARRNVTAVVDVTADGYPNIVRVFGVRDRFQEWIPGRQSLLRFRHFSAK